MTLMNERSAFHLVANLAEENTFTAHLSSSHQIQTFSDYIAEKIAVKHVSRFWSIGGWQDRFHDSVVYPRKRGASSNNSAHRTLKGP